MVGLGEPNEPTGRFWMDPYEFPNRAGEKPLTYTDLTQAEEACRGVGKRLCTAAEWRRACQGPSGTLRFSHGPNWVPGRCHTEDRLPSGHTSIMDPDALVKAAGTFPDCVTPEGIHDLIGSLEEWVLDDYAGRRASLEGGAWYTQRRYADCSGRYSRQADYRLDPDREVFSAGVRCCWTPEAPAAADIVLDRDQRMAAARARASARAYDPEPEVKLADGTFMDRFEYPNVPGAWPLVGVTWSEADASCRAAGKRLCSTREWEQACGGPDQQPYPYGWTYSVRKCATERAGAVPAGTTAGCEAPGGAKDLVGSAWEWTSTPLDAPVLSTTLLREVRGGSWFSDDVKATCRPTDGYPAAPETAAYEDVGFRCCRGEEAARAAPPLEATGACPEGMTALPGLCIDRYEHPNGHLREPAAEMSFEEALAGCMARGLRLCTGIEWGLACAGRADRRWPYGDVFDPEACHDGATVRTQGGRVLRSGEKPACVTPEGVADLSGNLWEWTQERGSDGNPVGVLRGGGWNLSAGLGQCRARATPARGYRSAEVGARCCATPAPR